MFLEHLPEWKVCQQFGQLEMCQEKHHSLSGSIICNTSDRLLPREMAKKKKKASRTQETGKSAGFPFQPLTVSTEQLCHHSSSALWTVLCDCQWFGHLYWGKQKAWDSAALCQTAGNWWLSSLSSSPLRTLSGAEAAVFQERGKFLLSPYPEDDCMWRKAAKNKGRKLKDSAKWDLWPFPCFSLFRVQSFLCLFSPTSCYCVQNQAEHFDPVLQKWELL